MTIPVWPASVPYKPRLDPYRVTKPFGDPVSNQVEDGPPIARRWASANWSKISYETQPLTNDQSYQLFAFFRDVLGHGSSRFAMPVDRKGVGPSWPNKIVYITPGSIQGPDPYGAVHYVWKFELNVLDF